MKRDNDMLVEAYKKVYKPVLKEQDMDTAGMPETNNKWYKGAKPLSMKDSGPAVFDNMEANNSTSYSDVKERALEIFQTNISRVDTHSSNSVSLNWHAAIEKALEEVRSNIDKATLEKIFGMLSKIPADEILTLAKHALKEGLENIFSGNVDDEEEKEEKDEKSDDDSDSDSEEDSNEDETDSDKEDDETKDSESEDNESEDEEDDSESDEEDEKSDSDEEDSEGESKGDKGVQNKVKALQKQYNSILVDAFTKYAPECIEQALEESETAFGENIESIINQAIEILKDKVLSDFGIERPCGCEMGISPLGDIMGGHPEGETPEEHEEHEAMETPEEEEAEHEEGGEEVDEPEADESEEEVEEKPKKKKDLIMTFGGKM